MVKVIIMVGLPGSGKSSEAVRIQEEENDDLIIVNKDALRTGINGGVYVFDKEKEGLIHSFTESMIVQSLLSGRGVIVDETNILKQRRKKIIDLVRRVSPQVKIEYIWCNENYNCLKYRMRDSRGVGESIWKEVIDGMRDRFECPDEKEAEEFGVKLRIKPMFNPLYSDEVN